MTVTVSIGSGKGGAGKSTIISNLGILLAKAGKRVCLVDLDIGGADLHIMFGLFSPELTLTDYLARKVDSISSITHDLDFMDHLQLIPGTGDTLQTANLSYQEKRRLLRSISNIDADVVLIDVGAGTSYHVLDFFMHSDIQICVTLPEPTAIMDFYTFLQLATVRKTLSSFLSTSQVSSSLKNRRFETLAEVFQLAEEIQDGAKEKAQQALRYFNPLLITNKTGNGARLNRMKLQMMTNKYLGVSLPDLGEIPEDQCIVQAGRHYLPISEYDSSSPAATALQNISHKLIKVIDLFIRKQQK